MRELLNLLDRAGASLHEGFATEYLGRRGAIVAFLVMEAVMPPSVSNLWVLGVCVLAAVSLGLGDLPAALPVILGALLAISIGGWSSYLVLRQLAQPPGVLGTTEHHGDSL